ncbi:hypothetical protein [Kitasatospora cheerisanensis]|uniref:Uncharacterized protein n=1 Tax=Kitasatospora cheerisanensis KCTC 2395 TaxID=1348663 RepID=A0A066YWE0_9ACTN|nr:hypothetical protein [Kitasatospora cheerisanensis]KDN82421.1 hypothetical protein KCH_59280 [Kitasatospora cheerisanensis KCTC 2395]
MSAEVPGIIDFQLYLLNTMDAPRELLHGALTVLRVDAATVDGRAEHASQLLRPRPGLAQELRAVLATAGTPGSAASGADGSAGPAYYSFAAWPELRFQVEFDPSGFALARAGFVRARAGSAPAEVAPWKFLTADLETGFDEVEEVDVWGHYETYTATDAATGERCFLRFGWGLLQEVGPVQPDGRG